MGALPSYGDPGPGTIHVVVSRLGFERPGHYYLPKGTRLGLLIDVACWKPIKAEVSELKLWGYVKLRDYETHYLLVEHHRGGDDKTDEYRSHLDQSGMPFQHRQCVLLDGDEVFRSGISF